MSQTRPDPHKGPHFEQSDKYFAKKRLGRRPAFLARPAPTGTLHAFYEDARDSVKGDRGSAFDSVHAELSANQGSEGPPHRIPGFFDLEFNRSWPSFAGTTQLSGGPSFRVLCERVGLGAGQLFVCTSNWVAPSLSRFSCDRAGNLTSCLPVGRTEARFRLEYLTRTRTASSRRTALAPADREPALSK